MNPTIWTDWDAAASDPAACLPPLVASPAAMPVPAAIPPREWLYGTSLIRRYVSVLVAPGGVGKSALALAQCVALASGNSFLGPRIHHSVPAWLLNLEDPLDELDRRLAALMIRHQIAPASLAGRLFLHSGRDRRVCLARQDADGLVVFPDQAAIVAAAQAHAIGCIMVDPFVKSHGLEENSNAHMDAAATAWAEVAQATGAAIQLVHHVRKSPPGAAPDVDSARGGKALTDAARVAMILSPMSEVEAEQLGVAAAERWRYIRLDDVKANMAPRATRATWYVMDSIPLGNATADYPAGDRVAAIAAWGATSVWSRLTPTLCNRVLDLIAAGPEPQIRYAAKRAGRGTERWAGRVLVEHAAITEGQAAEVIAAWLKSGLLRELAYRDPAQRKTRFGVTVTDSLRPTSSANPTPDSSPNRNIS